MDAFCEQLAREIIGDVKNELKTRKDQNESPSSIPVPSNYALTTVGNDQRPPKRAKSSATSRDGGILAKGPRRSEQDERDIDQLADRLTSDIISHATTNDYSPKDKKRDRTKKELKKNTESNEMITDNTQIPANDYQKTVINYQNDDECFLGAHDKNVPVRRSSFWNTKNPKSNSIWHMTDD